MLSKWKDSVSMYLQHWATISQRGYGSGVVGLLAGKGWGYFAFCNETCSGVAYQAQELVSGFTRYAGNHAMGIAVSSLIVGRNRAVLGLCPDGH